MHFESCWFFSNLPAGAANSRICRSRAKARHAGLCMVSLGLRSWTDLYRCLLVSLWCRALGAQYTGAVSTAAAAVSGTLPATKDIVKVAESFEPFEVPRDNLRPPLDSNGCHNRLQR